MKHSLLTLFLLVVLPTACFADTGQKSVVNIKGESDAIFPKKAAGPKEKAAEEEKIRARIKAKEESKAKLKAKELGTEASGPVIPYTHPGIVSLRGGEWQGSDHMLNLSNGISVYVEFSKPDSLSVSITAEELEKRVAAILAKSGINPRVRDQIMGPYLPMFNIVVTFYPVPGAMVCSVTGSLYEDIQLKRIKLDSDIIMQAITWELEIINTASTETFNDDVIKIVEEVATAFADRYSHFSSLKQK